MRLKIESTPLLLELNEDVLVRRWDARTIAGVRCIAYVPEVHPPLQPKVLEQLERQDDGSGEPVRLEIESTPRICTIGGTTRSRAWMIIEGGRGEIHVVALQVESDADLSEFEKELRELAVPGGICGSCGCSDLNACEGGCAWVNDQHTLCSRCVGVHA